MRFYGGSLVEWRAMPVYLVREFVEQLPRLQAEEALASITAAAVSAGTMKKHDQQQVLRDLKRQATPPQPRRRPKVAPNLDAIGIGMVHG